MRRISTLLLSTVLGLACATPALSAEKAIIIMDASGSMWGQIEGKSKIEIARETLGAVIGTFPDDMALGLIAYGHREKGACSDIEQLVETGAGNRSAITDAVNALNPKGKTPLSDAVKQAAESLKYTEDKATVILVTDGIETCDADPCALANTLEQDGIDFTAHVVGFGLSKEEGQQVACLADNTGGKFIEAKDAGELTEALTEVAAAPDPKPEPKSQPVAIDKNVTITAMLAESGVDAKLNGRYDFYPIDNGDPAKDSAVGGYGGTFTVTLEPGQYLMRYKKDMVERTMTVDVPKGEAIEQQMVLDAGVVSIETKADADADVDKKARFDVMSGDVKQGAYGPGTLIVPAGPASVTVKLGEATATEEFTVEAGKAMTKTVIAASGRLVTSAVYAPGSEVMEGGNLRFDIYGAKKTLDGKRKNFTGSYGSGDYMLPPGDYVVVAKAGAAITETPVTVTGGALEEVIVDMNAGILVVNAPGARRIDILNAKKNLAGKQKNIGGAYGEDMQIVAHPGDYVIKVQYKDRDEKLVPASVEAAAREEVEINLE